MTIQATKTDAYAEPLHPNKGCFLVLGFVVAGFAALASLGTVVSVWGTVTQALATRAFSLSTVAWIAVPALLSWILWTVALRFILLKRDTRFGGVLSPAALFAIAA